MAKKKISSKMWIWHSENRSHAGGAFIFAGSVIWILNIMGIIPVTVPWWLQFLAVIGFTLMFN